MRSYDSVDTRTASTQIAVRMMTEFLSGCEVFRKRGFKPSNYNKSVSIHLGNASGKCCAWFSVTKETIIWQIMWRGNVLHLHSEWARLSTRF